MTEHSYVGCTALASLRSRLTCATIPRTLPLSLRGGSLGPSPACAAPRRGWFMVRRVRCSLHLWHALRGLIAGVPCTDTAIRRACAWLLAHQRPDGGWGEHHHPPSKTEPAESPHSQVIQSAGRSARCSGGRPCWRPRAGATLSRIRRAASGQARDGWGLSHTAL